MCNCSGRPQAQWGPSYMVSGIRENPPPEATLSRDYKLLVDEVFVISRKIKVEVGVISRSERLRLITINSTFMILDIIKTSSNNCFITQWTKKKWTFTDGKQHKARELDIITLRNHAQRSYMTWLPVTLSVFEWSLTWLLYNMHLLLVSLAHSITGGAAELIFTSVIRISGLNHKCRDYVTLAKKLSHLLGYLTCWGKTTRTSELSRPPIRAHDPHLDGWLNFAKK